MAAFTFREFHPKKEQNRTTIMFNRNTGGTITSPNRKEHPLQCLEISPQLK